MTPEQTALVFWSGMMWGVAGPFLVLLTCEFKLARRSRIAYVLLAPLSVPLTPLVLLGWLTLSAICDDI